MGFQLIRARLARVVLESDSSAGRVYNLVVFGAILLSVVGLLFEPARGVALASSPPWLTWLERLALAVFAADFVLHLLASPRPLAYLRSFYGLIDLSAVLFFGADALVGLWQGFGQGHGHQAEALLPALEAFFALWRAALQRWRWPVAVTGADGTHPGLMVAHLSP